MVIEPFVGPEIGVVLATKAVPSTSESPVLVKSPKNEVFTEVDTNSLSIIGVSLIGLTVTVKSAEFEITPLLS